MARGDSRKKNIKRDWINVPASKATDSKVQTKGKAMKKDLGVPDLRQFSKKLMRHVVKEKVELNLTAGRGIKRTDSSSHAGQWYDPRTICFS